MNTLSAPPKNGFFSPLEIAFLDQNKIPRHVAIIPDGNRRWAKLQASQAHEGHKEGADNLVTTLKAARELGIKSLTFYLFSTENWARHPDEIQALMWLLEQFLIDQREMMLEEGVRFNTIGNLSALSESACHIIEETKKATAHCTHINMIAALNYGSRDEICRAFKKILSDCLEGKIDKKDIHEELISSYLDTAPWGDPDLLIRSSGEMRLSNFLLWQISYSEIYMTDILWPDFQPCHLLEAVRFYQSRERRLGGTSCI